ncbi:type II toxin-antitoxin system prevent-host-death family antitoxin [Oerskovia sp. M15]
MSLLVPSRHISVTEASARGVAGLVKDVGTSGDVIVTRHGKPVAAVVSTNHLDELRALETQLRTPPSSSFVLPPTTGHAARWTMRSVCSDLTGPTWRLSSRPTWPQVESDGQRLPAARRALVRLTEPAVGDLHKLMRKDPQIVRWCLKKILLLERDPLAGEPLVGGLVGFRRLVVSDRHWRVVWRVTTDASGTSSVEIAEVWAAGTRAESEVYDEMNERLAALGDTPEAKALHEVVSTLGRIDRDLDVAPEPGPEPVPSG